MHRAAASDERIRHELAIAARILGDLEVEHAAWILVPTSAQADDSTWISAVGLAGVPVTRRVRLPFEVFYDPGGDEKQALLEHMREAASVIHVHNHPQHAATQSGASDQDRAFAEYWQSLVPLHNRRMRFFVVRGSSATEYSADAYSLRQWNLSHVSTTAELVAIRARQLGIGVETPERPGEGVDAKAVSASASENSASAGWYEDPTGHHDHRYWDGTAWTQFVSDAGVQSTDAV